MYDMVILAFKTHPLKYSQMLLDNAIFITIWRIADLKIKIESHVLQIARPL